MTASNREPFRFYTKQSLPELTGLMAGTAGQLLSLIKEVPDSCIYHHTHRFLRQHQYLSPEPPNDFAYWASGVLGDDELGEALVSIDTMQYLTIRDLRGAIARTIEGYLEANPMAKMRFAREGEELHFIKSVSFVLPTNFIAHDLNELAGTLKQAAVDSIYFHVFEARLRLGRTMIRNRVRPSRRRSLFGVAGSWARGSTGSI